MNYSQQYLTFVALETGTFKFSGNTVQYSMDSGTTWTSLSSNTNTPTVQSGERIMWKATGLTPNSTLGIGIFSSTGNYNVEGNVMSMLFGDDFQNQTSLAGKNNAFKSLFSGCTSLTTAGNLVLPATTLASSCYYNLFRGCTSLTKAPKLPATTLASSCYSHMFEGCTSLTTAPELPATILSDACYYAMFKDCSSMTTAPILPALTLTEYCYNELFNGCTSLNSIKCYATSLGALQALSWWTNNVASTGSFGKNEDAIAGTSSSSSGNRWGQGRDGIPIGWTVYNFVPKEFSVDVDSIDADYTGGTFTVELTSDLAWAVAVPVEWFTVSPESGLTSSTLTITVAPNYGNARTATLLISDADADEIEITISQEKYPVLIPFNNIYRGGTRLN